MLFQHELAAAVLASVINSGNSIYYINKNKGHERRTKRFTCQV